MRCHDGSGGSLLPSPQADTCALTQEVEAPFEAIRLLWLSHDEYPLPGCTARVASSQALALDQPELRFQPVRHGLAQPQDWRRVSWAGQPAVELPAAAGWAEPGMALSDWVDLPSQPRSDGPPRPLLLVRAHQPGSPSRPHTLNRRRLQALLEPGVATRDRLIDVGGCVGDAVTHPDIRLAHDNQLFLLTPLVRLTVPAFSVAAVGDSNTQGVGSSAGLTPWLRRACFDLSTPQRPVVPSVIGLAGQPSGVYEPLARRLLALWQPSVVFYSVFSPNDHLSNPQGMAQAMARAEQFVAHCRQQQMLPILTTPVPMHERSPAAQRCRREVIDRVRRWAAADGLALADFAAHTEDPQRPDHWLAALHQDALHPNDAGHEQMAGVAREVLRQVLGT